MKRLFLITLIVLTVITVKSQTKFFIEQNVRVFNEKSIPTTTIGSRTIVSDTWSHGAFALITEHWAQVYYGLNYSTGQTTVGLKLGLEQGGSDEMSFRFSPSIFWISKNKKLSYLLVIEKGINKDDHWWTTHLDYRIDMFTAGLMSRRYYGSGVRLQYQISEHFSLWGAPLYDTEAETWKGVVALKASF